MKSHESSKKTSIKQYQDNVQFAAMVESMDESMGRVLDKLHELNLNDNTIVIFYSDNGGMSAAIFWHFPHYSNHGIQSAGGAVRSGDYKLLEYFDTGAIQLFNLKDDIEEQNDLFETEPEKVNELKKLLHLWREFQL